MSSDSQHNSSPSADADTQSLSTNEAGLKDLSDEQIKRYTFLLGQSELFYHFLKLEEHPELAKELKAMANKKNGREPSHRHRKTEAEEDKELTQDAEDESSPFLFTSSPPYVTGGTMRDYQVHGLNWLISLYENNLNGILADEMGLGKTLQVISFLGYLRHFKNTKGPHLVVVPKTTLYNWKKEFEKWTPDVNAFLFHGDKQARPTLIKDFIKPVNFNVCITSYEMCLLEKSALSKIQWEYIVIDEAHRIKNEDSLLSKIVRVIKSNHRLLITGTPLQNNLHELWALLNFLLPDVFGSSEDFDAWFDNQSGDQDYVVQQLHKVLSPFLLRRIKSDVEKSLLPKKETNVYVGLTTVQRKLYQKILEKDIDAVNGAGGKKEGKTRLQNVVMHLRKCCNHPYLFDGIEPGPPYTNGEHLVENCGKMIVLDRLLKRLQAQGSRVLIFSQMSRLLDILEDYCEMRSYKYCRIDGQTSHEDRIEAIDTYNAPGSEKFIFLLTTRAGGLGINLVTADVVILFDSDWNPQVDLQAQDRAHRIGQTKQVYVFRFVTENAIEEKVLERAAQKLRLDQLVIQQGRLSQQQKAASKDDLLSMIQHGAQDMFNSTESTVTDDDIEAILRKGEEKTKELTSKYSAIGLDDLAKFTSEGTGSVFLWDGEDYKNKRKDDDGSLIGSNWIQPAKRERKVNYAIDDYYREAMRVTPKNTAPRAPRPPKHPNFYDFQFLPKKLLDIYQKEIYHYRQTINYKAGPLPKEDADDPEAQAELEREQKRIDEAEALTEEEQELKEKLSDEGFYNWSKREFNSFIKAMEKYGRDQLDLIAEEVENKTPEEVKEYYKVFWKRYTEITDYQKFITAIERGESRLRRQNEIQEFLTTKLKQYKMPIFQLKIPYGQSKGKFYSEEEDRFLVIKLAEYGFGNDDVYDQIRDAIRHSDLFRFNWFIKSRTSQEIGRRCNTLVSLMTKDAGLNF